MVSKLHDISSLNNLGKKGQVATLLILVMVAVLVFILVTVNIGSNAVTAVKLANAADGGTLLLASQLATKARGLYDQLGGYRRCKKTSFLKSLFKIVAGAVAGGLAAGPYGAIAGGVITYGGELVGQRIEAKAMANLSRQLSRLPEKDQLRENVFLQMFTQTVDDPNDIQDYFDSDGDGDTEEQVPYFQYWFDKRLREYADVTEQMAAAIKGFVNGSMGDFKDEVGIFLDELSRPHKVKNQNGEIVVTTDPDGAIVELLRALDDAGYDAAFYEPDIPPFVDPDCEDCSDDYYDIVEALDSRLNNFIDFADMLENEEIEELTSNTVSWIPALYDEETTWTPDNDGEGINADFYDSFQNSITPTLLGWKSDIEAIRDSLPDSELSYLSEELLISSPSKTYQARADEFSREIANINDFLASWGWDTIDVTPEESYDGLTITSIGLSEGVINYTYSYEYTYEEEVEGGDAEEPATETVTATAIGSGSYVIDDNSPVGSGLSIPESTLDYFVEGVSAFSAFISDINPYFATIDEDAEDEFDYVLNTVLAGFIGDTQEFPYEIWRLCRDLDTLKKGLPWGNKNPATYSWVDSLGEHKVMVQVGNYVLPSTYESSHGGFLGLGKTYCVNLKNHSGNCWVKVTRQDPANKQAGILGRWNPTASGSEDAFTITRQAKAYYTPTSKPKLIQW